jgi:hypothetical protein
VFDGNDNRLLANFLAFDPSFTGGVAVACEDVNNDGRKDVIVGTGPGASAEVKVIDGYKLNDLKPNGEIADDALLGDFYAFGPGFTGGVTLGQGDYSNPRDGMNDIIIGAGPGAGPDVKIVDATKLRQVLPDGTIAESAQLANFYAFDPSLTTGVYVSDSVNPTGKRDLVVSAGAGAGPIVEVIDGNKLNQVQSNGQIADSALLTKFYAFDPSFLGGVRVSADDLNNDGQDDIELSAGPGIGPQVKVIDAAKLPQYLPNGEIADSALVKSFTTDTNSQFANGGVFIGADADHRDGPVFGPPGVTIANSRVDINDTYIFQSPTNPNNTVLSLDVSPFASATTPNTFQEGAGFEFRIANRDIVNNPTNDLTFLVSFGPADPTGVQDVSTRALPAAKFPDSGGTLVKAFTRQDAPVRGGGTFFAGEADDPFFFDSSGFSKLLDHNTAVEGVLAGVYPTGTSPDGFGPGSHPNLDGPNFFGPAVTTLNMTMEVPSSMLLGPEGVIGLWSRTEVGGVTFDRMGLPAINTALIPPVPRGPDFPIGQGGENRQERRTDFNQGNPNTDRANFLNDMVSVLTAFYPAGMPKGVPDPNQAAALANLLLPDMLTYDPTSKAGFGSVVMVNGQPRLGNGRKFSDDIISTELSVLTDDDLPAAFGGGPDQPALVTQNVRDDNGLNLKDGSLFPSSQPTDGTQIQRQAVFPYIGMVSPTGVPGGNPPPGTPLPIPGANPP